jgi:hypothetical protein
MDRTEHLRRIGAMGGRTTAEKYGRWHMSAIGKAGAKATIQRHGVGYWRGLLDAKGYRRKEGNATRQLALDLAYGHTLAEVTR